VARALAPSSGVTGAAENTIRTGRQNSVASDASVAAVYF